MTAVDESLMLPLGLHPNGTVHGHTPSTNGRAIRFNQYDVVVTLRGSAPGEAWNVGSMPVMATSFTGQSIQGLVGTDVLDKCLLHYNGKARHFTVAY